MGLMSHDSEPVRVEKSWGHELWVHNDSLYCGKVLHFNCGAKCSLHYHRLKHETFYLHTGDLYYRLMSLGLANSKFLQAAIPWILLCPGQVVEVPPGTVHQLWAVDSPVDLFEFSTQHFDSDSIRIAEG